MQKAAHQYLKISMSYDSLKLHQILKVRDDKNDPISCIRAKLYLLNILLSYFYITASLIVYMLWRQRFIKKSQQF